MSQNDEYKYLIIRQISEDRDIYEIFNTRNSSIEYMYGKQKEELKGQIRYADIFPFSKKDIAELNSLKYFNIENILYNNINERDFIILKMSKNYVIVRENKRRTLGVYKSIYNELIFASNCDIILLPENAESFMNNNKISTNHLVVKDRILDDKQFKKIDDSILSYIEENKIISI